MYGTTACEMRWRAWDHLCHALYVHLGLGLVVAQELPRAHACDLMVAFPYLVEACLLGARAYQEAALCPLA